MSTEHERLNKLFSEALGKASAGERERYLAEACGTDRELRRQVDSLLLAHGQAGDFLKQTIVLPQYPPIGEAPGDRIGRYKLLEKIGEGGCGVVYMADQEEPIRRRVALKVIKLGMDTKSVVARFEAERQALAMMDHPNIAKVLDAGATDTGRPYFVMELVKGIRITEYCDQNNLPTTARLDLFNKVCSAIQHAHQKGIIHRDIKPSNVLVTLHDGVPVPKVIDFGIAKATEGRLTDKTLFTAFEQFIGTPAYMSPEQAEMSGLDIDTRSDIYALGVLLYELLTGTTPFDAKDLLASGIDAMRKTIREQEPVRPSTRLTQELVAADASPRPSTTGLAIPSEAEVSAASRRRQRLKEQINRVRGDLDWIVMKCLEKDRTRRYETANGLAMDIERHLNNEPVVARPPSGFYRFHKMVRRNKFAFAAVGAVACALVLGVVMSTWEAVRATQAEREQSRLRQRAEASEENEVKLRRQAEIDEKLAKTEGTKSRQVTESLKGMLKEVNASVALGRDTTILRDILDRTAERVGRDLKEQPVVEAELREIMGDTYQALCISPQARAMHREALRLRQALFGTNHLAVASSLEKLSAAVSRGYDRPDMVESAVEGERLLREAMAIRQRLSSAETADTVRCLSHLAWLRAQQYDSAGAESLYNDALEMGKRVFKGESPELAGPLRGLGLVLQRRGDLAGAEANLREALRLTKPLGDSHLDVDPVVAVLATVLHYRGEMPEAEKFYQEHLKILKHLLGDAHPLTLAAQSMLSVFYACCGRERDAEPLWRNLLGAEGEFERYAARNSLEALLLKPSLVPLASDSEQEPVLWRYTFTVPATNWVAPAFDEHTWQSGPGLFGTAYYQPRTYWDLRFTDIWLRREFDLAEIPSSEVVFRAKYDNELEIFLNGVGAAATKGPVWTAGAYWMLPCSPAARAALKPGRNVIAVHLRKLGVNGCVDVGLYAAPEWRRARLRFTDVLDDALQRRPGNLSLLEERADLLAQCGEWKEAAAGFKTLTELQPTNHWFYHKLAPLLVQSGDIRGYERLRKQILARYGGTTDPVVAERMAKSSLFLLLSGDELNIAVRLAEVAASADTNHWAQAYFQCTKGLAEYRQGHFANARQRMEKVLAKAGEDYSRDVQACMVLAMAHHQLNQTSQARAAMVRGIDIAEGQLPEPQSGNLGDEPHDWIIAHALLREAQALIAGQPAAANEVSK